MARAHNLRSDAATAPQRSVFGKSGSLNKNAFSHESMTGSLSDNGRHEAEMYYRTVRPMEGRSVAIIMSRFRPPRSTLKWLSPLLPWNRKRSFRSWSQPGSSVGERRVDSSNQSVNGRASIHGPHTRP